MWRVIIIVRGDHMKYVIITGAYGGMGYAALTALKNKGYFIFAIDRRVGEACENVMPIEADLTDGAAIERAFEKIKSVTDEVALVRAWKKGRVLRNGELKRIIINVLKGK